MAKSLFRLLEAYDADKIEEEVRSVIGKIYGSGKVITPLAKALIGHSLFSLKKTAQSPDVPAFTEFVKKLVNMGGKI